MKNRIIDFLCGCASKLHMYDFFTLIGIEGATYRLVYRKQVKKSANFFNHNRQRIERICSILKDAESVSVYQNAIRYRVRRYRHDHPKYNSSNQYFPKDIINLSANEVFIDCGAYTGDTFMEFEKQMKRCVGGGVEIYCI